MKIYVLHGYYSVPEDAGSVIVKVTTNLDALEDVLSKIADERAAGYIGEVHGYVMEKREAREYKITAMHSDKYAKFFITDTELDEDEDGKPEADRAYVKLKLDEQSNPIRVKTPRGTFIVADQTEQEMRALGFGEHHRSDDGKYAIMTANSEAYAVKVN